MISGFFTQFLLGLAVLRWQWGATKFHEASALVVKFIEFTNAGTAFVFGFLAEPPNICGMTPVFAFSVRGQFKIDTSSSQAIPLHFPPFRLFKFSSSSPSSWLSFTISALCNSF